MNKTVVAVGLMVLIGFYIWVTNNRFYITSSARGIGYEVDRKTGESWYLCGDEKTSQNDTSQFNPGQDALNQVENGNLHPLATSAPVQSEIEPKVTLPVPH